MCSENKVCCLNGTLKIILIRESFSVSVKHEICLRIGRKMRGGESWKLETYLKMILHFSNIYDRHQQIMVSQKLPTMCTVDKIIQKGPFIVRPLAGQLTKYLFFSGWQESGRTGSGKFDNLRPNLINGALKSAG